MKIAHVPFGYYPDPAGGTEVYVRSLARAQQEAGHEVLVIAPAAHAAEYEHEGVPVFRYAVADEFSDIAELYASDTSVDAARFEQILRTNSPDILHVHGYGRAVTRRMMRTAKQLGLRIVFTYHTPTATCLRGTLMRWGDTVCDGALIVRRCTACVLNARGVPRPLAQIAALLPPAPATLFRNGSAATGLRMRELVTLRHDEIRAFLTDADQIIAPAEWVRALLAEIGVSSKKITLNRQGTFDVPEPGAEHYAGAPVQLLFLGRMDRTKGLDVIVDALATIRDAHVELHVYTVMQGDAAYQAAILARARADERIIFHDAVPQEQVFALLQKHDVLLIPSQWLETGPLVVLEAFAAGLPVMGSRLGGIAELVHDGTDGLLVESADVKAWAAAILRIVSEPGLRDKLRLGIRRPRTMAEVAREMDLVYAKVLAAA